MCCVFLHGLSPVLVSPFIFAQYTPLGSRKEEATTALGLALRRMHRGLESGASTCARRTFAAALKDLNQDVCSQNQARAQNSNDVQRSAYRHVGIERGKNRLGEVD